MMVFITQYITMYGPQNVKFYVNILTQNIATEYILCKEFFQSEMFWTYEYKYH
jgi:hypothetical protein